TIGIAIGPSVASIIGPSACLFNARHAGHVKDLLRILSHDTVAPRWTRKKWRGHCHERFQGRLLRSAAGPLANIANRLFLDKRQNVIGPTTWLPLPKTAIGVADPMIAPATGRQCFLC